MTGAALDWPPDRIENPSEFIRWWDYEYGPPEFKPMRGSVLPCGCYIRLPDMESILCQADLDECNERRP